MAALGNTHFYKQFGLVRTALYMLALCAALFWTPHANAAANPAYTVEGVEVDVTAENAVKAREKALAEGQLKAYQMLAERFLSPEELKTFKMPDADTVSLLVQDYEVTNEQLSAVRYKGIFTVRFRPNAMKMQMASQGKTYSDVQQKPVLVLPYFQNGGQTVLWDENNPWMKAWRTLPSDKSMLQPAVLPLGDTSDMTQVPEGQGMSFDPSQVQALAGRYNADDVAILLASVDKGKLVINMYHNGFEGPVFVQKSSVDMVQGETTDAMFTRAAMQMKGMLRQDWKANAAYVPGAPVATTTVYQPAQAAPQPPKMAVGPSSAYPAIARFGSVQDWVKLKNTLDHVYGVQGVAIKSLKTREAYIDIRFVGDIHRLQQALQNAGVMMRATSINAPIEVYMNPSQPLYRQ